MKIIRSVEVKDKFEVRLEPYAEVLGVYILEGKPFVSFLAEDVELPEEGTSAVGDLVAIKYRFISVPGKNVPDGVVHDGQSLVFIGSFVKEEVPHHVFEIVD